MTIDKILVVDDEPLVCRLLSDTLERKGWKVTTTQRGLQAIALLKQHSFDLMITDMKLEDMTGIDLLQEAKRLHPQLVVVVIAAYGTVENAVEAMRRGAFNYLIKPFSSDTIEALIDKASEQLYMAKEGGWLGEEPSLGDRSKPSLDIIAESSAMKQILDNVCQIAKSHANVFITGESGTGKEVIAQAIHYHSPRVTQPFIKVNCAAIPDSLIESEFFGHEKGAFTGATARKLGRIERAHQGSLLLDELTETPLMLQAKLLRVVQEQELERLGGTTTIKVDVRFISTSNKDVAKAVAEKELRQDLLYRLNVVPIVLPPLRERPEDIIPLAESFIKKMCTDYHIPRKELTARAREKLLSHSWPGNVRELSNVIERTLVLGKGSTIEADQLLIGILMGKADRPSPKRLPVGISLKDLERQFIIETLSEYDNNRRKAAEVLGISERKLRQRLQQLQQEQDAAPSSC